MNRSRAWGWLAAGVLALGLNGFYQDGGFAWAHRVADRIVERSQAVIALAKGQADEFLAQARILTVRSEDVSSPAYSALARAHENLDEQILMERVQQQVDEQVLENVESNVQANIEKRIAGCQVRAARMQAEADRRQARLDAAQARMNARLAAQTVRINLARAAFNSANFAPGSRICVRLRGRVPATPILHIRELRIPVAPAPPEIHIEAPGAGPV